MNRVKENEEVRKEINNELNDPKLLAAMSVCPEKAAYVALGSMIHLIYDISRSLAVIADKMSEVQQDGE